MENGLHLLLDPEDYVQCMMYYGRYAPEMLELFHQFVKPGDQVADIGAHIGYFSTYLASLVTHTGQVYSFEPDPRALNILENVIRFNKLAWVKVFPIALSSHQERLHFHLAQGLGSSTAAKNSDTNYIEEITVDSLPLDMLVEQKKILPDLSFIKMDIEGFEVEAIKGMKKVLETSRPVIVTEVNEKTLTANGESSKTLFTAIRAFDYSIQVIKRSDKLFTKTRLKLDCAPSPSQTNSYYDILCLPT